jgi:hypothetical protein
MTTMTIIEANETHEARALAKVREVATLVDGKRKAVDTLRHEAGLTVLRTGVSDPDIDARLAKAERELGVAVAASTAAGQAVETARATDRREAYERKVAALKSALDRRDKVSAEIQRLVRSIWQQLALMKAANADLVAIVGSRPSVLTPAGHLTCTAVHAALTAGTAAQRCIDAFEGRVDLVDLAVKERADLLHFIAMVEQHGTDA